jgi:hypothetical protein
MKATKLVTITVILLILYSSPPTSIQNTPKFSKDMAMSGNISPTIATIGCLKTLMLT